ERRRADRGRRLQRFSAEGELAARQAAAAEPRPGDPLNGPQVHPAPRLRPQADKARRADRPSLGVEILAVVGLLYIFVNGLSVLDGPNQELAAAFRLGSQSSPAPLIGPVVLPSGHTPPGAGAAARPNEAEIPEHLRPQMQAYLASLQVPTP